MGDLRTLGVEEELHVVSLESGQLVTRAPQLLRELPSANFSVELQRSTVETNTPVCRTLADLHAEMRGLRDQVHDLAESNGLAVIASGSAPLSKAEDFGLTTLGRYSRMQQDYRSLVDEQLICGLQVHVGVDDRDVAVRVAQRVEPGLPALLAMSASSPYLHGNDTGYSSFRSMIWQRWPTAGSFGHVESAAEYDQLVADLIESEVISDAKMAYFDVRPSAHVPTLELRVCDATPNLDDALLIAGLFRAMVEEAVAADERGDPLIGATEPMRRAAMWRAARHGLRGVLLQPGLGPTPAPASEVIRDLVQRLRPWLEGSDDWDDVNELATALLARGESSHRQRARYAERGKITDVVSLLVAESSGHVVPVADTPALTAKYPESPEDEAIAVSGIPFPVYRPLLEILDELGPDELAHRSDVARAKSLATSFTFGVAGEQQPFPADLVPRIIPSHEWAVLATGLTQRARAIEMFLRDVYGPARIVADGVVELETLTDCPGWRPEALDLPDDVIRAPIVGFDLVRDAVGGWRVLEDNARVPSGVGYALGLRDLMRTALPELSDDSVLDPYSTLELIGHTLRSCSARPNPTVALLSDGADNSAWYEHRIIAEGARLLLVQPDDIAVTDAGVYAGGKRIHVVYLRLGVELVDLVSAAGHPVGREIMAAAQAGAVVLANAPGAGVADDKAMYCLVPDIIEYYLHERPLLQPVPTYRCAIEAERGPVLARLDQLVTKPVDGYGGSGVLIGPQATAAEIARRRVEIEADPAGWVAQEVVALSTHPTLVDGVLEPRHVDLRAFVYLTGIEPGSAHLADLALTRMGPPGSMVVNSSRGGGAKDTWIVVDPADPGNDNERTGARGVRTGR